MAPTDLPRAAAWAALAFALLAGGCRRNSAPAAELPSARDQPAAPAAPAAAPALADVHQSLKAGSYDDAAARLLALQASGRPFTPKEAAEYRKAMNEAYTEALLAAEKGDARAAAAIQMIRAANAH